MVGKAFRRGAREGLPMPTLPRRRFLQASAVAAVAAVLPVRRALANPFGLPLGLQLYSVRDQLQQDYPGTLKAVGRLGYKEVEAAGFYNQSVSEVRGAMEAAGLRCVSAHYNAAALSKNLEAILEFHDKLGTAQFIICSFPGFRPGAAAAGLPFKKQVTAFTPDDWKWNAEQFNTWGKRVRDAGFQFGYHNHTMEFKEQAGTVPYEVLLNGTDPKLVIMELDCGWVTVGGGSPEHYLRTYADRIRMLHVKDFATDPAHSSVDNPPPAAELGRGTADYPKIFAAVKPGAIRHMFVEQEAFPDLAPMEALRVDADYMAKVKG